MDRHTGKLIRDAHECALNGDVRGVALCIERLTHLAKIEGVPIPPETIAAIQHTLYSHDAINSLDWVLSDARHDSIQSLQQSDAILRDSDQPMYIPILDSTLNHIELERHVHGFPRALRLPENPIKKTERLTVRGIMHETTAVHNTENALFESSVLGNSAHSLSFCDTSLRTLDIFNRHTLNPHFIHWRFEEGKIVRRS